MIPSSVMDATKVILCVVGTTASGKSACAVREARKRDGEIISVDSRQVYTMLDIGTEKITTKEMEGIPHHLISIRDPKENYSAGDFVRDASKLIQEIQQRGKLPILAGGTHFYFHSLLYGLPEDVPKNIKLREELESVSNEELMARVRQADPRRGSELDPNNRRRLIRALEIIAVHGKVPTKEELNISARYARADVEWLVLDTPKDELRNRIDTRLKNAIGRGLIEEVKTVRAYVSDKRLNEFGLEYRIIGEFLRGERSEESLFPTLSSKLWQYARHQKAWLRKLT